MDERKNIKMDLREIGWYGLDRIYLILVGTSGRLFFNHGNEDVVSVKYEGVLISL